MKEEQAKLVEENIRLVTFTIQKYYPYAIGDEDMFQIGCLGLIKAAKNFKDDRGMNFGSYAVMNIRGEICKEHRARKMPKRKANFESVSLDNIQNSYYTNGNKEREFSELLRDCVDVEENAVGNALFDEAIKIVNGLRERQRDSIILYYLYGMSQSQIAEILGIKQASVSRCIIRGCENTRKEMGCVC